MSDQPKEENSQKNELPQSDAPQQKSEDDNKIEQASDSLGPTCAGGMTDEELDKLKKDLDEAKEANSFSSTSMCVVM
jgi:hypothetical protein